MRRTVLAVFLVAATASPWFGEAVSAALRWWAAPSPPVPVGTKGGGCVDPDGRPLCGPTAATTSSGGEGGGCVDPNGRPRPCA